MPVENKIAKISGTTIAKNNMISDKDKILVAFSGGKDSYCLLDILLRFQKKAPIVFELFAVIIDSKFGQDYSKAELYFKKNKINYLIKKTNISSVIKNRIKIKNNTGDYCFLCSRLRRGILYKVAKEKNCTKIALGHNLDDAGETLLMNLFYNSSRKIMPPMYTAEDKKNIIIRPLIEVPEKLIIEYAKEKKFKIVKQKCPLKKSDSKRDETKKIILNLSEKNNFVYSSLKNAMFGEKLA
ncbi:MAG: ATP-binding protein [archaeon]